MKMNGTLAAIIHLEMFLFFLMATKLHFMTQRLIKNLHGEVLTSNGINKLKGLIKTL
jgi:hypothetical protein